MRYVNSYQQDYIRLAFSQCMQENWSTVIGEQEKNSNPIYRVVFNKIRNLKKKLSQIQHIRTLDPKTLKPAQQAKLLKAHELEQEIHKNQEFARYYKSILIENNLSHERTDDLLKLATLLTVGRRVQRKNFCPEECRELYEGIYSKIFGVVQNQKRQLSDEVVSIYHHLSEFLEKQSYYTQCRDYMSYLPEIDERMTHVDPIFSLAKPTEQVKMGASLLEAISEKMGKLKISEAVVSWALPGQSFFGRSCEKDEVESMITSTSEKHINFRDESPNSNPERDSSVEMMTKFSPESTDPHNVWRKKSYESVGDTQSEYCTFESSPQEGSKGQSKKRKSKKAKNTVYSEIQANMRKCSEVVEESREEKPRPRVRYVEKSQ